MNRLSWIVPFSIAMLLLTYIVVVFRIDVFQARDHTCAVIPDGIHQFLPPVMTFACNMKNAGYNRKGH